MAEPTRIGVRELRGKLAYYLREARKGHRFLVTLHGKPMAVLGPPSTAPAD
jgi:prevent-host-death family protein